ncbi:MAG: hypothetical protein U1D26_00280 [Patescibacteria group bacterium]|nr:hypothetical protein [Patescibacteria group bacterium]
MEKEPLKHNGAGGRLRDTYMVGPEKDHVAKIPKEGVVKHYPFGSVTYPTALYTLLKFGKANVNEADYANYKALPEAVRKES